MVREREGRAIKNIRMEIDADIYARVKNEMYKRRIYTWKEFFQYIVDLLEKLDEEDKPLNNKSSNQSIKEENQAKEVSGSTVQAQVYDHGDHYISADA